MDEKIAKHPIQVVLENEEWKVVKSACALRGFKSLNVYMRGLIERDISEYKKSLEHPWLVGMRKYDWDNLSESEKEKYMNQIGPVIPGDINYFIDKAKGRIVNEEPLMGDNDLGL